MVVRQSSSYLHIITASHPLWDRRILETLGSLSIDLHRCFVSFEGI